MCSAGMKRLMPTPRLVSFAPELLSPGDYPYDVKVRNLISDVSSLDMVSFRTDLDTLHRLNVLTDRPATRLLVVPPNGISRSEAEKLQEIEGELTNLDVRQVNTDSVSQLVHLKQIVFKLKDGRSYAIVGSSNLTKNGTVDDFYANAEINVLVPIYDKQHSGFREMFESLWDGNASTELRPYDFAERIPGDDGVTPGEKKIFKFLDFQRDAYEKLVEAFHGQDSGGGVVLSMPTGAGKTVIAARLLLAELLTCDKAIALWIAPHVELLLQAESTFQWLKPYWRSNLVIQPHDEILRNPDKGPDWNVEFRTNMSAYKEKHSYDGYHVVVIDEAHYGATHSRLMLPKLRERFHDAFFLGLTGTPFRKKVGESKDIADLFGKIVHVDKDVVRKARDAKGNPILAEVSPIKISTEYTIDLDDASLEALEWEGKAIKQFNNRDRNKKVASAWKNEYKRTLVFSVDIDHANSLARTFKEQHPRLRVQVLHSRELKKGVPSEIYPDGSQFTTEERKRIHNMFSDGKIDCLISVDIYTMGVDFPDVDAIFMARPTLSPVRYAQMLGRGLRGPAFGGTNNLTVVDFADQAETFEILERRIMNFQREEDFEEFWKKQLKEIDKLKVKIITTEPTDASYKMDTMPGLRRALMKSGKVRKRWDWRWVEDIGKAIRNGINSRGIQRYDEIDYIPMKDRERGHRAEKLLQLASSLRLL